MLRLKLLGEWAARQDHGVFEIRFNSSLNTGCKLLRLVLEYCGGRRSVSKVLAVYLSFFFCLIPIVTWFCVYLLSYSHPISVYCCLTATHCVYYCVTASKSVYRCLTATRLVLQPPDYVHYCLTASNSVYSCLTATRLCELLSYSHPFCVLPSYSHPFCVLLSYSHPIMCITLTATHSVCYRLTAIRLCVLRLPVIQLCVLLLRSQNGCEVTCDVAGIEYQCKWVSCRSEHTYIQKPFWDITKLQKNSF